MVRQRKLGKMKGGENMKKTKNEKTYKKLSRGKAVYYIKQLIPMKYQTKYRTSDGCYISSWYMWMGMVFNHTKTKVCM